MTLILKHNKDEKDFVFNVMQEFFKDLMFVKATGSTERITNIDKTSQMEQLADKISQKTPQKLLEILLKYVDYISKNISYAQIAQCISLELWEAINDRGYRSKI